MNSDHPYFLRNDVFRSLHLLKDQLFRILTGHFLNIKKKSQDIEINNYEQHMAYVSYGVLILLHILKVDI